MVEPKGRVSQRHKNMVLFRKPKGDYNDGAFSLVTLFGRANKVMPVAAIATWM